MKFYDRKKELEKMEDYYNMSKKKSIMSIVTGRRRVGKTRLIREFIEGKENSIYFFVTEKETPLLLDDFKQQIESVMGYSPSFKNWEEFFRYLSKIAERHTIIIFDEFQNFNRVDKSVFSIMQKEWDENKDSIKMLLLCIGSYVGLMKKIFVDSKQPLYGRITGSFKIEPFTYLQTRTILDDIGYKKEVDKILMYSIFGGVPKYYEILELFGRKDVKKIIREAFLAAGAPLLNEGYDILIREFGGSYRMYFSILEAISRGKSTVVEIANAVGSLPTTLSKYLSELVNEYDIVVKKIPVTEIEFKSKKGRYFLKDNLLKFWFEFIYKNKSFMEIGNFDAILDQFKEQMNAFVGRTYENVIQELMIHYNNRKLKNLDVSFKKIGSWWDRSGNEVDVCAFSDKEMLLGEVKWGNKKVDVNVAESLVEKSKLVNWKGEKRYMLFSKNGFTEKCRDFAWEKDFLLLDIKDVKEAFESSFR